MSSGSPLGPPIQSRFPGYILHQSLMLMSSQHWPQIVGGSLMVCDWFAVHLPHTPPRGSKSLLCPQPSAQHLERARPLKNSCGRQEGDREGHPGLTPTCGISLQEAASSSTNHARRWGIPSLLSQGQASLYGSQAPFSPQKHIWASFSSSPSLLRSKRKLTLTSTHCGLLSSCWPP